LRRVLSRFGDFSQGFVRGFSGIKRKERAGLRQHCGSSARSRARIQLKLKPPAEADAYRLCCPPGKITDSLIGPQGPILEAQWHQSHRPQQER
jgi:hypothetical protein